jgi:hypothetical protein
MFANCFYLLRRVSRDLRNTERIKLAHSRSRDRTSSKQIPCSLMDDLRDTTLARSTTSLGRDYLRGFAGLSCAIPVRCRLLSLHSLQRALASLANAFVLTILINEL